MIGEWLYTFFIRAPIFKRWPKNSLKRLWIHRGVEWGSKIGPKSVTYYLNELLGKIWKNATTGGPRYSRTFYLRIRLFTLEEWFKMTIVQSKMDFLSANSRYVVKNDGTYLPRITRETCMSKFISWFKNLVQNENWNKKKVFSGYLDLCYNQFASLKAKRNRNLLFFLRKCSRISCNLFRVFNRFAVSRISPCQVCLNLILTVLQSCLILS
jgi:hypothetical protein